VETLIACASVLPQFLELGDVVEVVAGHGFYDGGEGHGAALGVGYGLLGCRCWGVADQDQVPLAHGGEGSDGLLGRDAGVGDGPLFLVKRLEDVVVFGEGLAEAKAEGDFAVGEMAEDFGGGPLAGRGETAMRLGPIVSPSTARVGAVAARISSTGRESMNLA
jgi:hypothetical protein